MYDKIAQVMNREYGSSDMDSGLVENYLREGKDSYISEEEISIIETLVDRFL